MLKKIFGPKRVEETRERKRLYDKELYDPYSLLLLLLVVVVVVVVVVVFYWLLQPTCGF